MPPSATAWLTDVLLIVFGQQWRSIAQGTKLYLALASQIILVRINSLLVLIYVRNLKYRQPYPLRTDKKSEHNIDFEKVKNPFVFLFLKAVSIT